MQLKRLQRRASVAGV